MAEQRDEEREIWEVEHDWSLCLLGLSILECVLVPLSRYKEKNTLVISVSALVW